VYQNCCKKCGSISLHTEVKGSNTGLYCDDCGAWVKWLGKDELRAFEYSQKDKVNNDSSNSKDITTRLNKFVEYLDRKIDSEYEKLPLSPEDAISKNSYCLALEQDKNAILNILRGHDFNYIEE
jgi:hypothetical protein